MTSLQPLPWAEPLELAHQIADDYWALLYSGCRTSYSGRYSLLAYGLEEKIVSDNFNEFSAKLSNNKPWHENLWLGYLGYELKHCNERLPHDEPPPISLPALHMMRFRNILRFDHEQRTIECYGSLPTYGAVTVTHATPRVSELHSNMSSAQYRQHVQTILDHIHAGDLYQANLTRKFFGSFTETPEPFALFASLCTISPAPYSAYLRLGDTAILSSSPELFLSIDHAGNMRARPIKGTSARNADPAKDAASRSALANSDKDKAENLMIVDLMRNDLSRSCIPGSVQTHELFEVTSHANVHHMSSTITGQRRADCPSIEAVRHCFPPGSMTGAPKIRAMTLCSALEKQCRGPYAGAIGYFDGTGACELSVVIRTLILRGRRFEFQVGGAIVADSDPQAEQQETFDKASGVLTALGIPVGYLKSL
ncbi:MAG: aminodeoxychorismate synthase component I [Alphaproteobacteria bacterium]